jgi:hypothetical protein
MRVLKGETGATSWRDLFRANAVNGDGALDPRTLRAVRELIAPYTYPCTQPEYALACQLHYEMDLLDWTALIRETETTTETTTEAPHG